MTSTVAWIMLWFSSEDKCVKAGEKMIERVNKDKDMWHLKIMPPICMKIDK